MTDIRPNDIIVGEDDVQKAQGILSGQGYSVSSRLYFKGTNTANGGYTPGKSLLSISGGNVEEARNILKQNNIVAHTGSTTHLDGPRNQEAANDARYAQPNLAVNDERYADTTTLAEQGANPPVPKKPADDAAQENRTFGAAKVEGRS